MKLTNETRDALIVGIARMVCPELLNELNAPRSPEKGSASGKKPFANAIGYEEGERIISSGSFNLMTLCQPLCVKRSDLERVSYSLGMIYSPTEIIPAEHLMTIWKTYCSKRGW